MPSKLKVYGYLTFRQECPVAPNGSKQTREIVAATSKKAVKLLIGDKAPLSEITETGNAVEIAAAMSRPGTIFWTPVDSRFKAYEAASP